MLNRRWWRQAALAVGLVLGVTGCDGGAEPNTLVLWHAWGGRELDTLKELVARYKALKPEVEVLPLQVPYDKLRDKFTRSAAANGGPDMVIGDADWSARFAASDLLTPVDDLFTAAELDRFAPGVVDALRYRGRLFALPESRETVALYYNRRLMPQPPRTISEWLARAAAVSATQDATGLVLLGNFYTGMGYFFGAGGRLFTPDGRAAVGEPPGLGVLSLLARFADAPGVLVSPEYAKPDSMYQQGKAAMIVNGPWALVDYQAKLGTDLGVARLPSLDDGRQAASWVGIKCVMFNRNSDERHRQLAHDFGLYMTSAESQALLAEQAGHIPAVRGYRAPEGSPLSTFAAQADVGTPVIIRPEMALVWEPMDQAIRKVAQKKSTPSEALQEADAILQARLATARDK